MSSRGKVWLVEDSPLEAQAALQGLAPAHDVTLFADGPSMIERFSADMPDVILLDWHLPALSGIEICRYLRGVAPPLDLGIIVVTGLHRKVEDLVAAFDAGADDYVVKPYAQAELVARVGALVRGKRLRRRAALAEQALRNVLDHLPDPLFVLDQDGSIRSMNAEAVRLFQRGSDPIGSPGEQLVPGLSARASRVEFEGRIYQCAAREVELTDGVRPVMVVTLRDETEAHRQVASRDAFLAVLAHELRNPLAPILTALELGRMSPGAELGPRTQRIIERQVERLVRLVDDLLEISRVTRGRIELRREATDVGETIVRSIEDVQSLLESQRHSVVVQIEDEGGALWVDADPVRLEQVFSNLLHNAAKYTAPGGRIRVDAARVASDVVVHITDEGIGIPAHMLHRVFELFVQDGTAAGAQTGLGVGLTLARQLVEMHGGTIDAASGGVGKGARFSVRLPLTEPAALHT